MDSSNEIQQPVTSAGHLKDRRRSTTVTSGAQLPLALDGPALRDEALALLERTRADYIKKARYEAWRVLLFNGEVSADDLHERCPVPAGIDPRVMGAVFRGRFRILRYQPSRRAINHARIIPVWGKK